MCLREAVIPVVSSDQLGKNAAPGMSFRDFNLPENELKVMSDERNHYRPPVTRAHIHERSRYLVASQRRLSWD